MHQSQQNNVRASLSESLEELAAASQRVADFASKIIGDAVDDVAQIGDANELPSTELARQTLAALFDPEMIEGYDGSETMEKARVAYLDAALDMYLVMAEEPLSLPASSSTMDNDLATRIGRALVKELTEYYDANRQGNDRTTFTTEQRTALESAFLLKPKLNTAEKRALARACNLKPRQVEVWVRAQLFTRLNRN